LVEFLGTYILVFVGCWVIIIDSVTDGVVFHLWIYIISIILGATLSVFACKLIQTDDCCTNC